jgi:hypothetical protein
MSDMRPSSSYGLLTPRVTPANHQTAHAPWYRSDLTAPSFRYRRSALFMRLVTARTSLARLVSSPRSRMT